MDNFVRIENLPLIEFLGPILVDVGPVSNCRRLLTSSSLQSVC